MVKNVQEEKKKVNVFQIEYETSEFLFKVNIAAWSKEDAFGYLSKMMGKTSYKISGFTSITSIDAITTQVTDDIIKATIPKTKIKSIPPKDAKL